MIADEGPLGFPVLKVTILEVPVSSVDPRAAELAADLRSEK